MAKFNAVPPLVMSAKRAVWRMHDHAGDSDKAFAPVRKAILDAAEYRCEFCGHHSTKYQEAHHVDDDHKNNAPANLRCACPLCHQVFHVGLAGMKEGGEIHYLPEFTQAEINQIALMLWIVEKTDVAKMEADQAAIYSKLATRARSLGGIIETRRQPVFAKIKAALEAAGFPKDLIQKLRKDHISLSLFANVLMSLPDDKYDIREELMGGLRIFPKATRFAERIEYWRDEQSAILPITSWEKIVSAESLEAIVMTCATVINKITPTATAAA